MHRPADSARPRTPRRLVTAVATFVAVVGAIGLLVDPAAAHNWSGATNARGCNVNITDTSNQSYHYSSLPSASCETRSRGSRTKNVDPLVLTTSSSTSWNSLTDIVAFQGDWSGNSSCRVQGTDGVWYWAPWCCETALFDSNGNQLPFLGAAAWWENTNPAGECEQHRLYFDTDNLAAHSWGENYLRGLVCHEIGHTLGLWHGDACMVDPATTTRQYFSDQRNHINGCTGF